MQIKSNQLVLKTDCGNFVDPGSAIAARLLSCLVVQRISRPFEASAVGA
jgi:hypothetical protein